VERSDAPGGPPRKYGRLTISPACITVALFIHRAVRLAASELR